jgi:hypothetical protein
MPWPFRRRPAAPPANTVVIDADVAAALVTEGAALESAVNGALRDFLAAKAREAREMEARGIPFWLRRDAERSGDIEEELRDRVIHRRSAEDSGA